MKLTPEKIKKLSSSLNAVCRICYEEKKEGDPLLNPCRCHGSIKYIHNNCLGKWINTNCSHDDAKCELCGYKYRIEYQSKKEFSKERFKTFMTKLFLFISIVLVIMLSFDYLLFKIVEKTSNVSHSQKTIIIVIEALFSLLIVIIFIVIFYMKNYNRFCYIEIDPVLNILNFSEELDESQKILNCETIVVNNYLNENLRDV